MRVGRNKKKKSLQSPGQKEDVRVSSTGVKFRFKNIPIAKWEIWEENNCS